MAAEPIDNLNIDNINSEESIKDTQIYKIRKYSFNSLVTSINLILFYLLIRYVIYPIFYTLLY